MQDFSAAWFQMIPEFIQIHVTYYRIDIYSEFAEHILQKKLEKVFHFYRRNVIYMIVENKSPIKYQAVRLGRKISSGTRGASWHLWLFCNRELLCSDRLSNFYLEPGFPELTAECQRPTDGEWSAPGERRCRGQHYAESSQCRGATWQRTCRIRCVGQGSVSLRDLLHLLKSH